MQKIDSILLLLKHDVNICICKFVGRVLALVRAGARDRALVAPARDTAASDRVRARVTGRDGRARDTGTVPGITHYL